MKRNLQLITLIILFFAACGKDNVQYSILRKYSPNSFATRKGAELVTTCERDTNIFDENGKPIESAYYATVKGEFVNVEDTILYYGHCWSKKDHDPHIALHGEESDFYTKFEGLKMGEGITFESRIPDLMPETPFWVRSYVITINKDTAYNKYVFSDTTLSPVNEWFSKPVFQGGIREGAVAFTMYSETAKHNCGYVGTGNDGSQTYSDFWEFDPVAEKWTQKANMVGATPRTEAVGFALSFYDENGTKQYRALIGTGLNSQGATLEDFWRYDPHWNTWAKSANYKVACSKAVAFAINGLGYVGTGQRENATTNEFYSYNPKNDVVGGDPWKQISSIGNTDGTSKRMNAVAFVIGQYAFVGTGEQNGTYFNDLWMFMPGNGATDLGTWKPKNNLPIEAVGRAEAVAFSIANQGYLGLGYDGTNILKDFWRYDPFNDSWYKCADFKIGPNYPTTTNSSKAVRNAVGFGFSDRGFVALGYVGLTNNLYSSELWVYRPW